MHDLLFEVRTPVGFTVRCTTVYWQFIVSEKHPTLQGHEYDIQQVLVDPDEVRRSKKDMKVYLFYRGTTPRWLCAVARQQDGSGFLVTAYPTDAVKIGEVVWKRSK